MTGKMLMQMTQKVYGMGTSTQQLFIEGHRHIFRHPFNDRDQEDARLEYMEQIKTEGIIEECRSEIIGIIRTVTEKNGQSSYTRRSRQQRGCHAALCQAAA